MPKQNSCITNKKMFIGNIGTNAANGINDIILNTSFLFWNIFFI